MMTKKGRYTIYELLRPTLDIQGDGEVGEEGSIEVGQVYGYAETWAEADDLITGLLDEPCGSEPLVLGIYDSVEQVLSVAGAA